MQWTPYGIVWRRELKPDMSLPTAYADLAIWYDADQEAGADNSTPATITDHSGNGNTGTCTSITLKHAIVNGKKVFRFFGSQIAFATALELSSYSVFIVVKQTSASFDIFISNDLANNSYFDFQSDSFQVLSTIGAGQNATWGNTPSGNWLSLGVVRDSTTIDAYASGERLLATSTLVVDAAVVQRISKIGQAVGGFYFDGDIAEFILYNRALTPTERRSLCGSLDRKYNTRARRAVVCAGDSITAGAGGVVSYPSALRPNLSAPGYDIWTFAVSGKKMADLITDYPTQIRPLAFGPERPKTFCIFFAGTNDIFFGETAAGLEALYDAGAALARADGALPCFIEILPASGRSAGQETDRQTVNAWLRSNYPNNTVKVCDDAAFDNVADAANETYFIDGLHPTTAGDAIIETYVRAFILATSDDASGYTFSGPSTGIAGTPSSNFTITFTGGSVSGAQAITLSDGANGGLFTPSVGSPGTNSITVTPSQGTASFTFTYTPASAGVKTITPSNPQNWLEASAIAYTATAPASASFLFFFQ